MILAERNYEIVRAFDTPSTIFDRSQISILTNEITKGKVSFHESSDRLEQELRVKSRQLLGSLFIILATKFLELASYRKYTTGYY